MDGESATAQGRELVFGAFRLLPRQRLLYRADTPVRIGCRAREILLVLVERAGELVKKNELVARVWPGTVVEDGTLRVHIAGLRKILNDGTHGQHFIESVTGIGYRFVAPISCPQASRPAMDSTSPTLDPVELQHLREENARLRRVVANLTLEKHILEEKVTQIPRHRLKPAASVAHFPDTRIHSEAL
jgi:DNA-binding winged helix-turn-helix (wHTH) protein